MITDPRPVESCRLSDLMIILLIAIQVMAPALQLLRHLNRWQQTEVIVSPQSENLR